MKTQRSITFAMLGALALTSAELPAQERRRERDRDARPPAPATRPAAASYSEQYGLLEKRNLFVKDRSTPTTRRTSSVAATQPARRSTEESLVVRGIAMEEIGYRAYVEDLNTGSTLRLSPGDALGRGHVAAVALDAIAYDSSGKQTWIEIGSDLTGKFAAVATTSPSASAFATDAPATLPANVDLNDPSLTVEQRMKLRVQMIREQRKQGR